MQKLNANTYIDISLPSEEWVKRRYSITNPIKIFIIQVQFIYCLIPKSQVDQQVNATTKGNVHQVKDERQADRQFSFTLRLYLSHILHTSCVCVCMLCAYILVWLYKIRFSIVKNRKFIWIANTTKKGKDQLHKVKLGKWKVIVNV